MKKFFKVVRIVAVVTLAAALVIGLSDKDVRDKMIGNDAE